MGYVKSAESQTGTTDTAEQIKEKYESNANTNSFSDIEKALITELDSRAAALEVDGHTHSNKVVLDAVTAAFTTAFEAKLANITDYFKGIVADSTERDVQIPAPVNGNYCKQIDTGSFWFYGAGVWIDSGSTNIGDMLASIYDPQGISGDAFNRANHTGSQAISSILGLQSSLDDKVNIKSGKSLTDENFSTSDKAYLDSVSASIPDPDTFAGNFVNSSNSLKCTLVEVQFPESGGDFTVDHLLPSDTKVIGFCGGFAYSGATDESRQSMPPNFTDSGNFHYQAYVSLAELSFRDVSASNLYGRFGSFIIYHY